MSRNTKIRPMAIVTEFPEAVGGAPGVQNSRANAAGSRAWAEAVMAWTKFGSVTSRTDFLPACPPERYFRWSSALCWKPGLCHSKSSAFILTSIACPGNGNYCATGNGARLEIAIVQEIATHFEGAWALNANRPYEIKNLRCITPAASPCGPYRLLGLSAKARNSTDQPLAVTDAKNMAVGRARRTGFLADAFDGRSGPLVQMPI